MKKLFILIAVLATMSVAGCYREHCAGFDKEFQQYYFPYTHGQHLTFASSTGETILLVVSKISLSSPFNVGFLSTDFCHQSMSITITDTASNHDNHDFILDFSVTSFFPADVINKTPSPNKFYLFDYGMSFHSPREPTVNYHFGPDQYYIDQYGNGESWHFDSLSYRDRLCRYMDTICFTPDSYDIDDNNRRLEEGCKYVIDTFVVVKDKGVARFVTHDGQRYELVD
ncbi:MAG: hypothetical protein IJ785_00380 [Bacteroidales bacterium]|nr:hypothetical protein [Bacteroidales bacterium]